MTFIHFLVFESSPNLSHLKQVQVEEKRMILSPEMTLLGGRNMHFLPVTFSLVGERVNHHHQSPPHHYHHHHHHSPPHHYHHHYLLIYL